MGSLTEYGWFPAFSIDTDSDCIENIYVSILFSEDIGEDNMNNIELKIRGLIESGDNITLDFLEEIK